MELTLREIAGAVHGVILKGTPERHITGVSTDSRKTAPGEVFFALKGPNFDGHAFAPEVLKRGAAAIVVEKDIAGTLPENACVIKVDDTLKALGRLAAYYRGLFNVPVLAISGSAGKTTTKEMAASILAVSRPVLKTEGNLNNLIGLPLTLFRLDKSHRAAVVELGISEDWEMERLVGICRPDVGLITNIGPAHLESLGSIEGVAGAKGPLFTGLSRDAVRIVNLDDEWTVRLASGIRNVMTYSLSNDKKADVNVREYSFDEGFSGARVIYEVRGEAVEVRLNAAGAANIINGAAAIAAALAFGVKSEEMAEGLSSFRQISGRMGVVKTGNLNIIDDTYNANPSSVKAALKTLSAAKGRKVAILGDMLELGAASTEEHRKIGEAAGGYGIDAVISIGQWAGSTAEGARASGVKESHGFSSKKEALAALPEVLRDGDWVLVKGSRSTRLEEIVAALKDISTRQLKRACC